MRGDHRWKGPDPLGLDLEVAGDEPLDERPERGIVRPLRPLRIERREKEALGARAGPLAKVGKRDRCVSDFHQIPG